MGHFSPGFNLSVGDLINGYEVLKPFSPGSVTFTAIAKQLKNNRKVFFKKYTNPTGFVPWYHEYVDYQKRLKDKIQASPVAKNLVYEIVGINDRFSKCLMDTPEFVVSTAEYLPRVNLVDFFYPAQELNYRPWPDDQNRPTPPKSTTPAEKINAEIHEALKTNKATRIYLEREQLDSYLTWRLSHGASINFQYIRVDDADYVARENMMIGVLISAGVGICVSSGLAVRKLKNFYDAKKIALAPNSLESASERQAEKKETISISQNGSDRRPTNAEEDATTLEEVLSPAKTCHQHNTLIDPSTSSVSTSTSSTSSIVSFSNSDTDDSESSETVVHIPKKTTRDE